MADDTEVDLGISGFTNAVVIGRGGFAVVYRAYQPRFDRLVAVKVFVGLLIEEGTVATFERECRAIGRLSGRPNILQVYDAGISPANKPYMVMAYMAGGTLDQRLHDRGPLPWEEATAIGIKMARALQAAHDANVLHRDVKPENVLLSDDGEPYLGDFGISRLTDATRKTRTNVSFTPAHVAPEIVSSGEPSVAVDIYSLASTLFEVMAGQPAFVDQSDDNMLIILRRVINDPIPDLLAPKGVPEPIRRVIEGAMAKNPADRPHSASAFSRQLEAATAAANAAPPAAPSRAPALAAPDDRETLPPAHAAPRPASFTRPPTEAAPPPAPASTAFPVAGPPSPRPAAAAAAAPPSGVAPDPRSPWAPPTTAGPPPGPAPVRPAFPNAAAPPTVYSGPGGPVAVGPPPASVPVRPASPGAAAPPTVYSGPVRPASPEDDSRGTAAMPRFGPPPGGAATPPPGSPPPPRTDQYAISRAEGPPPSARSSSRTVLVVIAVIVVAIVVVVLILVLGHKGSSKASPLDSTSVGSTTTARLPAAANPPATTAPTPVTVPVTSLVSIAAGVASPDAAGIQLSLATYFNAVNNHDWQAAWNQFTSAEKAAEPVAKLSEGASSTKDSAVVVRGLTNQSDGSVVAAVSFTSMQAVADSPDHQPCDQWTLNYVMAPSTNGWLIGQSTAASNPPYQACPPAS